MEIQVDKGNTIHNIKLAIRLVLIIGGTILGIWLVIRLGLYLLPFVIGWLLALIARPLVHFLDKKLKIERGVGSVIIGILVLALVIVVLYFAISRLFQAGVKFADDLPEYYSSLREDFETAGGSLNGIYEKMPHGVQEAISEWLRDFNSNMTDLVMNFKEPVINMAEEAAKRLPLIFLGIIVTIFSAYYFMVDGGTLKTKMWKLLPQSAADRLHFIGSELKRGVGGYFKAQAVIMLVIFIILVIAFMIMGVRFGPLWAFLIALLDFLPFFGTGFVLIPWAAFKLLTGNIKMMIILLVLYGICLVVHQVLQPKLISAHMEINPLLTLLFIYVGFRIGGVLGIIIGLLLGMLVVNMYKIGAFDTIIRDFKDLMRGIAKALRVKEK